MFYRQRGEEDKDIRKILAGLAVLIAVMIVFSIPGIFQAVSGDMLDTGKLVIYLLIYLLTAYDVAIPSIRNAFLGKIELERLLITIASLGTFFVGAYWEACAVMFIFMLCENIKERVDRIAESSAADVRGINIINVFTIICILFAIVIAVIPPLVDVWVYGAYIKDFREVWSSWIYRGLICLAIACPCTLHIAENIMASKARQNIIIALVVKCIPLILTAAGVGKMWIVALFEIVICGAIFVNTKRAMK